MGRAMRIVILLFIAHPLFAQIPTENAPPSFTGQTGLFFAVDARTIQQGTFTLGFSAANFDQLYPEAPELRPVSDRPFQGFDVDRGEFRLFGTYGITDRWEISAAIPYIYYNQNIGDVAGFVEGLPRVGEFTDNGIGDITVATKIRFIEREGFAAAGSLMAELPTGETEGGIASGDSSYRAGIHVDIAALTLSAAYRHRGERSARDTPLGAPFDLADEMRLDAAWEYRPYRWTRSAIIAEINGLIFSGGDRTADDAAYVTGGVRHHWGSSCWTTDAAVNYNVTMGLSDNPSHPWGGLFSISCRM